MVDSEENQKGKLLGTGSFFDGLSQWAVVARVSAVVPFGRQPQLKSVRGTAARSDLPVFGGPVQRDRLKRGLVALTGPLARVLMRGKGFSLWKQPETCYKQDSMLQFR